MKRALLALLGLMAGCSGPSSRWILPHGRHPWPVQESVGGWDLAWVPAQAEGLAKALGGEPDQLTRMGRPIAVAAIADPLANAASPTAGLRAQWGLEAVRADQAWGKSQGDGVTVAVIDTGIDLEHPDLVPNLVAGDNLLDSQATADDRHGHGSHVAGIIAAAAGNGYGIAGVAPRARLLPVKVAEGTGSALWETAKGMRLAVDRGAKVLNLSLGFRQPSRFLEEAVDYAWNRQAVVVAAMGNDALSGNPLTYPAALPGVVAVAAVDPRGQRADFSTFGSAVALAAPGVDILSAIPVGLGEFAYEQGTSAAAPFVSGACALILAKEPNLTPADLRERLMRSASDLMSPGPDIYTGAGLLNCANLLP